MIKGQTKEKGNQLRADRNKKKRTLQVLLKTTYQLHFSTDGGYAHDKVSVSLFLKVLCGA